MKIFLAKLIYFEIQFISKKLIFFPILLSANKSHNKSMQIKKICNNSYRFDLLFKAVDCEKTRLKNSEKSCSNLFQVEEFNFLNE